VNNCTVVNQCRAGNAGRFEAVVTGYAWENVGLGRGWRLAVDGWQPTTFLRYVRTVDSSSRTALVHTDAGTAYLKAINNPQGPHVLACGEKGLTMGGQRALSIVDNIADLPKLVPFDTWVRNCDRYAPGLGKGGQARMNADNLFLSTEGASEGKFVLKAIDHGQILTCGRPVDRNLLKIDCIKEERVYGLFPFFRGFLSEGDFAAPLDVLAKVQPSFWEDLLARIPEERNVSSHKESISQFLLDRARFLADRFPEMLFRELNPGMLNFH